MICRAATLWVLVDLASEYRYRDPIVGPDHLVIAVSQSGETTDTLQALRQGADQGARVLAVTNTHESSIAREAHDVLYTHAGPEIGVASTKCFTAQVAALYFAYRIFAAFVFDDVNFADFLARIRFAVLSRQRNLEPCISSHVLTDSTSWSKTLAEMAPDHRRDFARGNRQLTV